MADPLAELHADGEILPRRLDYWARETPDRAFFFYGEDDVTFTYAQFADRTSSIAGNLGVAHIVKGDHVSVFCISPLLSAQAMFGIWKAGAVFCPVNLSYTGRLLAYQLGDTSPRLLITERRMVPALNAIVRELAELPTVTIYDAPPDAHDHVVPAKRVALDPAYNEISWEQLQATATAPDIELRWDDVANIFYTSGTTGPSKGVVQPYRWMNQYTFTLRKLLTRDDVVYNDLPLYHVGGAIANVGRAVWAGAGVASWDRFSSDDFWTRISRSGATAAILLDVVIPWLMNAPESPGDRRNSLNKVHMQPLPQHHAAVARRFGFDIVTAGFGQTETGAPLGGLLLETAEGEGTPDECYRGLTHDGVRTLAAQFGIPITAGDVPGKGYMGTPTMFASAVILDERDQECPPGEVGQLCLRSVPPGVFLCEYLGKPEATVAAFRNLWFHTGDAALRDDSGDFYFVDRLGDRIRVRGENISSFQIEDLINNSPDVELCAAFPIRAAEGDEDDVVVFAISRAGAELTAEDLHAWAAREMPKYMRPRHVRIVDDIPRTPTNKIEKYKLREEILRDLARA